MKSRTFTISGAFCSVVGALMISACAGYAGDVQDMRNALSVGDKVGAVKAINESLEVKESDQYPDKMNSTNGLLLLERASVQQSDGRFKPSSLDFRVADTHMELLDIKRDTLGNISQWVFSGHTSVYRAPSHEKLLLSTLNMMNYLSLGNLEDARVEARRLRISQQYLRDSESEAESFIGIGSYLAGFTFEMSGRYEEALQYYEEAVRAGGYTGLRPAMAEVSHCTSYRTDAIAALLGEPPGVPSSAPCGLIGRETGTILIIPAMGLAPNKEAKRIPIGAAIVIAGAFLTPQMIGDANEFAVKGLLKWVNFPVLTQSKPAYDRVSVWVDGKPNPTELGENVSALVKRSWDAVQGKIMAAAIVRMIARAAAGAATNAAVESGSGDSGLGLLAQVLVEGAMTAADTPDTRSWNALPSGVFVSRAEVPAGKHQVLLEFAGAKGNRKITVDVNMAPGGFVVIPVFTLQ